MVEVQHHGFSFEKWVCDKFFGGYAGCYMQKWDVPQSENRHSQVPCDLRGLPVSVKAVKYGAPIALGDALRQYSIDEPFLLIVGFWCQRSESEKWFEEMACAKIDPGLWKQLWGRLESEDLLKLDQIVKTQSTPYAEARSQAREWKKLTFASSASQIVINPKIDSKNQRRVQCSLPFRVFWKVVGREAGVADAPTLFSVEFDNPIISSSRSFTQD